jgi:hypothetical protein
MKKIVIWSILTFLIIFSLVPVLGESPKYKINNVTQPPNNQTAFTVINVTISEDSTLYTRRTFIDSAQEYPGIRRYSAIGKLTTHGDIFLRFNIEFLPTSLNQTFAEFKNSTTVNDYKNFIALEQLVPFNISLLEKTTDSFETRQEIFYNFETKTNHTFYTIEQMVVLRQTTTFLLALREQYQFDLNKLELGQLSDFHFLMEYFNDEDMGGGLHVMEEVRIKAPGSPLEYITNTKGFSGLIYLTQWDVDRVPQYTRHFAHADQNIILEIKLPREQEISFDFDSHYKTEVSSGEQVNSKKANKAVFEFDSDAILPHYVKIDSLTPFWAQFTLADYLSVGVGALVGLISVVKGLPYFWSRRSFGNFKQSFHSAVDNPSQFEALQQKALNRYMSGKLTSSQFEEIRSEVRMLKKYSEKVPEKEKQSSLEELLGR